MQISSEIFRAYDIRGIVEQTLTSEAVFNIGKALGTKVLSLQGHTIVVGRDGRLSGPSLLEQLTNGILSTGCNVTDVGLVPTPVLYFASKHLNISSAVMLTGSHNPPNYNGLKIIIDDITIYGSAIQELYEIIINEEFTSGSGTYTTVDVIADYIAEIKGSLKIKKESTVVVDCGNGVTGLVVPKLLRELGCKVIPLFCEVDGNFPNHHPDPSDPHNLQILKQTVIQHNADVGFAFDGDGDRLGIIDNTGKIIWPDRLLMLFAQDVLSRNPGATIIYDVKCSRDVESIIKDAGGVPLMWNTGHSLIKAKMRTTGALLAAEMSGHMFFKERWYGFDDALYTAARFMEIFTHGTQTSAQIFAQFPELVSTPELNITVTEDSKFVIMDKLLQSSEFSQPNKLITIDGMRVEFRDGWGLVRPSNTTPKLVVRFEAINDKVLADIQKEFRQALLQVEPALEIPF